MVVRRVSVIFDANTSSLSKGFKESAQAAEETTNSMGALGKQISENEKTISTAGKTLLGFGAAGVGALAASGKAAVDWGSQWAGVTKTVDGTEQQLASLEQGLRDMARSMPATHEEIAAVAEAAGQLGVETESIESFTKTMIDLGETTNLTADEAATSIAQLMNVMQTAPDEVDNLGSALVALGNDGASTERQIIQMAQGMAGAASIVGMAESDVLAIANAFASVGIEAEAGGTAFSRIITGMAQSIATGGEELETFAEVAGVSAQEFARAFEEDPAQAFNTFIAGLARVQEEGGNVFQILEDLGMSDVRVSRALLGMATSGDLLTESLQLGAEAWQENTALSDEAAKRYESVAAKISVAWNNIRDAAISAGEVMMPAVAGVSEAVADFAGWLSGLPRPIQEVTVGLGAIASGSAVMAGGLLLGATKLVELHKNFGTLTTSAPKAALAIKGVGIAAGIMAAAVVADEISDALDDWTSRSDDVDQLADAIMGVADAASFAETEVAWMTRSGIFGTEEAIAGSEALDRFADSAQIAFGDSFWDKAGRLQQGGSFDRFIKDAEGLDTALAQLVNSGRVEEAEALFGEFWGRVEGRQGVDREEVMQGFTRYEEALKGVSSAQAEAASAWDNVDFPDLVPQMTDNERAMRAQAEAGSEVSEAYQEIENAYGELINEMGAGSQGFVSLTGALSETQAKAQEWAQSQADATSSSKDSWEDFYDGFSVELDDYLAELQSMVDAQSNWQSNMSELTGRLSQETLQELAKLGPEAAPLVQALVDGTADQLAEFEQNFAASGAEAAGSWADGFQGDQAVIAAAQAGERLSGAAMDNILSGLQSGELSAAEAVLRYNLKAELEVLADTDPAAKSVLDQVNLIENTVAVFDTATDIGQAEDRFGKQVNTINNTTATFDTNSNTGPARRSVDGAVQYANDRNARITVSASTGSIYDAVGNAMYWIRSLRPVLRVGMGRLPVADGGPIALASGGPVRGPGGPREDLVPAYNQDTGVAYALSNGEHVLTDEEVQSVGGHGEVYKLRKAMLAKAVQYDIGGEMGATYGDRYGSMRTPLMQPPPAAPGPFQGTPGDTFNITNHYPVSEPTSTTIQRARDITASRGRF